MTIGQLPVNYALQAATIKAERNAWKNISSLSCIAKVIACVVSLFSFIGTLSAAFLWRQECKAEIRAEHLRKKEAVLCHALQAPLPQAPPLTTREQQLMVGAVLRVQAAAPLSRNRGKREDIARFVEPLTSSNLSQVAKKHGLVIPNVVTPYPDPIGHGICLGSCLWFVHRCFTTNNPTTAAREFTNGTPYEGVVLHTQYRDLFNYAIDEWGSRSPQGVQGQRAAAATAELVGLKLSVPSQHALAETLDWAAQAPSGTYLLHIPTYVNGHEGRHGIILMKNDSHFILFDPNTEKTVHLPNREITETMNQLLATYHADWANDAPVLISEITPQ